jgi:hypothetical protein
VGRAALQVRHQARARALHNCRHTRYKYTGTITPKVRSSLWLHTMLLCSAAHHIVLAVIHVQTALLPTQ